MLRVVQDPLRSAVSPYAANPFTGMPWRRAQPARDAADRLEQLRHRAVRPCCRPRQLALTFDDGPDPRNTPASARPALPVPRAGRRSSTSARTCMAHPGPLPGARSGRAMSSATTRYTHPQLSATRLEPRPPAGGHHQSVDARARRTQNQVLPAAVRGRRLRQHRDGRCGDSRGAAGLAWSPRASTSTPTTGSTVHTRRSPVPPLDGAGHVLLLHDGGGDRSATLVLVQKLIQAGKGRTATRSPRWPRCSSDSRAAQTQTARRALIDRVT